MGSMGDKNTVNLALSLCAQLQASNSNSNPREWRLIGQEQGVQLLSWTSDTSTSTSTSTSTTNIGTVDHNNTLHTLHTLNTKTNVIQASVNHSHTLLAYVVKELVSSSSSSSFLYKTYLVQLKTEIPPEERERPLEPPSSKQMMVQFLYKKNPLYLEQNICDKLLIFHHLNYVKSYNINLERDGDEDSPEDTWSLRDIATSETIIKTFSWAQWDPVHQVLYYIHYRLPAQSSIDVEGPVADITPTLSGLQFHEDLPHETVLNIPLNLPSGSVANEEAVCGLYEDDAVPLRVHDCSLDLQIVSHPSGIVCICHHYLYQSTEDCVSSADGVNFAYSVTLLHHGYVTHCVVPNLAWPLAKSLRPTFILYREEYLLVNVASLFTHMLDIGLGHEPCCHIVLPPGYVPGDHLAALIRNDDSVIDLMTLDIIHVDIADRQLVDVFKTAHNIHNKLAVLHYFLHHKLNMDIVEELIRYTCTEKSEDHIGDMTSVFKEFLIGGSYIATKNCLPNAALSLMKLLPLTSSTKPSSVKIGEIIVNVNQEQLWNTTMMLLSPRQRIVPFRQDMWIRLWEYLSQTVARFKHQQVREKLKMSLACYQPEALSRCSTPLSPVAAPPQTGRRSSLQSDTDPVHLLPFLEMDTCTASKQEHIISVNLREVSMHLLKHQHSSAPGRNRDGATHVHSVATRYAGAQLESSRTLCLVICKSVQATVSSDQERGFTFIDQMNPEHAFVLLKILEYYYLAVESMAFPLPQGFSSFFTYLGYGTLSFPSFLQYVHRNIFELQIDFLKWAIADAGDDRRAVLKSLRLCSLGGKERGRRALVCCQHPSALLIRARDHASTILAGQSTHLARPASASRNPHKRRGLAAFPSADRLSPLDTFLDLLTAKANLNELDFNLLIDATILAESVN